MGQQRWHAAEESLQKSVSLFDPQIERAMKSDSEFSRTEHAGNLRESKAESLAYLGIVYLREGRTADALKTADLAYAEAKQPNVSPTFVSGVVKIGRSIAQATGDKDAIANGGIFIRFIAALRSMTWRMPKRSSRTYLQRLSAEL
jgi:hypothetical protein